MMVESFRTAILYDWVSFLPVIGKKPVVSVPTKVCTPAILLVWSLGPVVATTGGGGGGLKGGCLSFIHPAARMIKKASETIAEKKRVLLFMVVLLNVAKVRPAFYQQLTMDRNLKHVP